MGGAPKQPTHHHHTLPLPISPSSPLLPASCLQDFLAPELAKAGYTAIYKKKTTELYTRNAYAIDGCATFFRRDRFALVKKYEVGAGRWVLGGAGRCWALVVLGLYSLTTQLPACQLARQ